MASEFNYKRAWRELANPQYQLLPQCVKDAFEVVATEGKHLKQDNRLLVPVLPRVFDLLSHLDNGDLSLAMKVIYYWGHWAFTENGKRFGPDNESTSGAYWKLELMIRQMLSDRNRNPQVCESHERMILLKHGKDHPMLFSGVSKRFMDHVEGTPW